MKYQPDRYVNKIRSANAAPVLSINMPPWFDTWEEAHAWLIADREDNVRRAKNVLRGEERQLRKAQRMRPKEDG